MARISVLPSDDATNGWALTAAGRRAKPALAGDVKADWVVIGAGFAGLAAARRLGERRPDDSIALVEAQRVGDGASGRNSGFVIDIAHNVGAADLANLEASRRATRLSRMALASLDEIVTNHQIQCLWSRRGQYQCAVRDEATLETFAHEMAALGEPHRVLDARQTAAALGTDYYRAAVHTPGTVLMQPAALVRGLADALPDNVTLYEDSPVIEVDYGNRITVKTAAGAIEAAQLILAVNAFAPNFGFYKGSIFSCRAFASITRPLDAAERTALGGEGDWGIVPTNAFGGVTLRYTQDHRILFRQMIDYNGQRFHTDPAVHAAVQRGHQPWFRARFPMLPDVTFEHTWVGYVCASRNFAPGFGRHAPNVHTAVCQNLVGATKGTAAGMLVADMACGEDNPMIAEMQGLGQPAPLPPRPFFDIGAWSALKYWAWRGRAEH